MFDPLAAAGISVDMIVQNVGHEGTTDLSFTIPAGELARARKILDPVVAQQGFQDIVASADVSKISIVGAGIQNTPGYAAKMFGALADAGINIEMISTSEIRITCIIPAADLDRAANALHKAFQLQVPEVVEA